MRTKMNYRADRCGNGRQGFTLMEVLLVLVILVILASLAVSTYSGVQNRAQRRGQSEGRHPGRSNRYVPTAHAVVSRQLAGPDQ